jgi:HSP20 family protein
MALTRWSPRTRSLVDFTNTIDSIFNKFFEGEEESSVYRFDPAMDVEETGKEFKLTAELPGMDKKDVNISIKDDVLTISGEKKEEKKKEESDYYRSERVFGKFQRSFRLPEIVEEDKIEAEFKNGILNVTIPKSKETVTKEKQIEIK